MIISQKRIHYILLSSYNNVLYFYTTFLQYASYTIGDGIESNLVFPLLNLFSFYSTIELFLLFLLDYVFDTLDALVVTYDGLYDDVSELSN